MDSVVSLWYYPSSVRDLEFLIQGLLLEKSHCLTAQHTAVPSVHETLFVLFALIQKLRHAIQFSERTRSDAQEKKPLF